MPKLRPNSQLYRTYPKEWLVGVRDTLNASDTINFSIPLSPARGIRPSIHLICLSVLVSPHSALPAPSSLRATHADQLQLGIKDMCSTATRRVSSISHRHITRLHGVVCLLDIHLMDWSSPVSTLNTTLPIKPRYHPRSHPSRLLQAPSPVMGLVF